MTTEFTLPELGENVTAGDVVRVLVSPGDTIAKDQPVVELETDKATVEVPSAVAGRVDQVKVKAGDRVKVGQVILTVDDDGRAASPSPAGEEDAPEPGAGADRTPSPSTGTKAADRPAPRVDRLRSVPPPPKAGRGEVVDISRAVRTPAEPADPRDALAPAAPSVRRLARELGLDINDVQGTGAGGRISDDDVKAHAKGVITHAAQRAVPDAVQAEPLPDFGAWGEVERRPMSGVRRHTAGHLSHAWQVIPHVTQYDKADIGAIERLRERYAKHMRDESAPRLTVTAFAIHVVARAVRVFPQFNASADMPAGEIVYKKYVHIGVAVDTDRGLLVPVVRDADKKTVVEISAELATLADRARGRTLTREEMRGGSFTITNLGGLGGTYFSPIVHWPEVAILGLSRATREPVFVDGAFQPRLMLPLSLSYDHRVIDGADAIRFLRWVADALEQPYLMELGV